jgi:hypothetical protein
MSQNSPHTRPSTAGDIVPTNRKKNIHCNLNKSIAVEQKITAQKQNMIDRLTQTFSEQEDLIVLFSFTK